MAERSQTVVASPGAHPRHAGIREMSKGCFTVTRTRRPVDIDHAQTLRSICFGTDGQDQDDLDARCLHFLICNRLNGQLVCCFRVLVLTGVDVATEGYSSRYYDLTSLRCYAGSFAELGRFCVHPEINNPDVLRIAWGALAAFVDQTGVRMLMGCSSFPGTDADPHLDSFAVLYARHLAPERWRPGAMAPETVGFAGQPARSVDIAGGLAKMPPLLRSYLMMGGRVSDHAVVDRQMNTLHVFTGLEVNAIPPARKRLLRAVLGEP